MENWDLSKFLVTKQEFSPTFDLYAVINHMGTLQSGHYTSFARNRDDFNWYQFNDSIVEYFWN